MSEPGLVSISIILLIRICTKKMFEGIFCKVATTTLLNFGMKIGLIYTYYYTGTAYIRFLFKRQALFTNDRARFYERVSEK